MERTYTISKLANMLCVNEETVRRWVRSGKLKPVYINSKKEGYVITETQLGEFLDQNPKYAKLIFGSEESRTKSRVIAVEYINTRIAELEEMIVSCHSEINELRRILNKIEP